MSISPHSESIKSFGDIFHGGDTSCVSSRYEPIYGLGFNAESAVHEIKSRCDVLDLIVLDLFRTR